MEKGKVVGGVGGSVNQKWGNGGSKSVFCGKGKNVCAVEMGGWVGRCETCGVVGKGSVWEK